MSRQISASDEFERTRIQFLDGELDICQTFLSVAETEVGDPEHHAQAKKNAFRSYETVLAWIGTVNNGSELDRLHTKLSRVKERLDRSAL